jgi:hypothetical protein
MTNVSPSQRPIEWPSEIPHEVFRVGLHVHVYHPAHVHPLVMQHHVRAIAHDFERRAGCLPDTLNCNRIASENGIVLNGS